MNKAQYLRLDRGLTLVEAADQTGISPTTLSSIERGMRASPRLMKALAGFYNLPEAAAEQLLLDIPVENQADKAPSLSVRLRQSRLRAQGE